MEENAFTSPFFWTPILLTFIYSMVGHLLLKYPPTSINSKYGYRTKLARTSQKHWNFAQQFSAIMFKKYAMLCLPFCMLTFAAQGNPDWIFSLVLIGIALLPSLAVYYQTERMLKEF